MITGNPKFDLVWIVVATVLFAASEAIGKSDRFKANGVIHFLCQFIAAGAKGVMACPIGIVPTIVTKCEPLIENAITSGFLAEKQSDATQADLSGTDAIQTAKQVQQQNRMDVDPHCVSGLPLSERTAGDASSPAPDPLVRADHGAS